MGSGSCSRAHWDLQNPEQLLGTAGNMARSGDSQESWVRKASSQELYYPFPQHLHGNCCHQEGRGHGLCWPGADSPLPGSLGSESSLDLDMGWNLSRTGGVKMDALTVDDEVCSFLGEPLQAEELHGRHQTRP